MPSVNDNDVSLWRQIAAKWYDLAVGDGVAGLVPPSVNDNKFTLIKKTAYYTARLV